ncbi:carboxymuconolactone decarboxylase family protein [Thiomicrorhabdus heinhorstiae]|uniref:Carboxymuconolactone decarboxylase family protein n=1 Tax=Thiomicrorhabdus heinhorstiae TaxID=2748010 RepID=A0ABS0BYE7_9GAMM|nr:carboxymuconolactone decarboxylase family protein [Thiomicrorhabdus heinhorstiae]MBF6058118.1 carboxymuconolactone decarboxylase family protein [Thiomicrorhabdus heinhorstiae]
MTKRIDYAAISPEAIKILHRQENYLHSQFQQSDTVPVRTWELVKLRVSQINQCAFCIDMHSKDTLAMGETAERIYGLSAWRDMPLYSEAERAALNWAERVTSGQSIDEDAYQQAQDSFGKQSLVDLTIAINAINSWNRIVKVFQPEVGRYQPRK